MNENSKKKKDDKILYNDSVGFLEKGQLFNNNSFMSDFSNNDNNYDIKVSPYSIKNETGYPIEV